MTPRIAYWRIDGRLDRYGTEAEARAALKQARSGGRVRAYTEWHRAVSTGPGQPAQKKKQWPL